MEVLNGQLNILSVFEELGRARNKSLEVITVLEVLRQRLDKITRE